MQGVYSMVLQTNGTQIVEGEPPFVLPLEDTTSQLFQDAAVNLTESNIQFIVRKQKYDLFLLGQWGSWNACGNDTCAECRYRLFPNRLFLEYRRVSNVRGIRLETFESRKANVTEPCRTLLILKSNFTFTQTFI